jgi:hypothetical protein
MAWSYWSGRMLRRRPYYSLGRRTAELAPEVIVRDGRSLLEVPVD